MTHRQRFLNITAAVLLVLLIAVIIWGCVHGAAPLHTPVSDGIDQIDLDTIYLPSSGVEVNFSEVILSSQNETRKLIVSTQSGTVTIQIGHPYSQAIEIDPGNIIDEVQESLLVRGDIELTVADYTAIDRDLRSRLEEKFDTAAHGQAADELAVKMVKEVYEPMLKAIDRRYRVIVQFK